MKDALATELQSRSNPNFTQKERVKDDKTDLVFVKQAEERTELFSSRALDLDEAVVGILDLKDDSLRVGIARPRNHRHGGLNKDTVQVELGNATVQLVMIVQSYKVG